MMIFKNIWRNKLPLFYFSMGFLFFCFSLLLLKIITKPETVDWRLFDILVLSAGILNTGYFTFGFSFDYFLLLNFRTQREYKKYLYKQLTITLGWLGVGLASMVSIVLGFHKFLLYHFILHVVLGAIFLIPFSICSYVYLFRKINLFDNCFEISKKRFAGYLSAIFQIMIITSFYFIIKDHLFYALGAIITVYTIFFYHLNYIAELLKKKVRNEYIGNQ